MAAEQLVLSSNAPAEAVSAVELPLQQRLGRFIEGAPVTQGVYDGPLATAPDGVYISPNVAVATSEADLPRIMDVKLLPGAQLGAGDSHHGVMFGEALIKVGEEYHPVEVALKNFTAESEAAPREHDAFVAARQRGFDTFEPLAIAKDGADTYLITKRRDDLESLDNADWTISPADAEKYEAEVVPNLHFIAESMALMHARGLFHGDAQPKNIVTTDTGGLVVMDLEDSTVAHSPAEHISLVNGGWDIRDSKALEDVWHCWYAMTHLLNGEDSTNVFLQGESFETCMQEFEQHVLNPYMKVLLEQTPPEVLAQCNMDDLRSALYNRVARTT